MLGKMDVYFSFRGMMVRKLIYPRVNIFAL